MNYYQPIPPFQGVYPYPQYQNYPYQPYPVQQEIPSDYFNEQSYIENILRDNYNKVATVYMNFEKEVMQFSKLGGCWLKSNEFCYFRSQNF